MIYVMFRVDLGIFSIVEACRVDCKVNSMVISMANYMVEYKLKSLINSCLEGGCYGLGFRRDAFWNRIPHYFSLRSFSWEV